MKKIILYTLMIKAACVHAQDPAYPAAPASPQNFAKAEYFINSNPTFGSGTTVILPVGTDVNGAAIVNTSLLAPGTYQLNIRSLNNEGRWSITTAAGFSVLISTDPAYPAASPAPGNITYAEYFFDTDPGFGNGTSISITPGVTITDNMFGALTGSLSQGNHRLFIRSKDDWSLTVARDVFIGASLPLRFLSFTVSENGMDVLLKWKTTDEVNTSHFDVETSPDGTVFSKIGEVNALQQPGENNYSFIHRNPATAVIYYRIKQVDKDGKYVYSKVIRFEKKKNEKLEVYPNPANEYIVLNNVVKKIREIQIISPDGKMLMTCKAVMSNRYTVQSLPKNIYWVKIIYSDNTTGMARFIKE